MDPILASDYGNLAVFVLVGPVLLIAVITGMISISSRNRILSITCGSACVVMSACFFYSLEYARSSEFKLTIIIGVAALLIGIAFLFIKLAPRPRKAAKRKKVNPQ